MKMPEPIVTAMISEMQLTSRRLRSNLTFPLPESPDMFSIPMNSTDFLSHMQCLLENFVVYAKNFFLDQRWQKKVELIFLLFFSRSSIHFRNKI